MAADGAAAATVADGRALAHRAYIADAKIAPLTNQFGGAKSAGKTAKNH
jgi:hypothetical protein